MYKAPSPGQEGAPAPTALGETDVDERAAETEREERRGEERRREEERMLEEKRREELRRIEEEVAAEMQVRVRGLMEEGAGTRMCRVRRVCRVLRACGGVYVCHLGPESRSPDLCHSLTVMGAISAGSEGASGRGGGSGEGSGGGGGGREGCRQVAETRRAAAAVEGLCVITHTHARTRTHTHIVMQLSHTQARTHARTHTHKL